MVDGGLIPPEASRISTNVPAIMLHIPWIVASMAKYCDSTTPPIAHNGLIWFTCDPTHRANWHSCAAKQSRCTESCVHPVHMSRLHPCCRVYCMETGMELPTEALAYPPVVVMKSMVNH